MTPLAYAWAAGGSDKKALRLSIAGSTCVDHSAIGRLCLMFLTFERRCW